MSDGLTGLDSRRLRQVPAFASRRAARHGLLAPANQGLGGDNRRRRVSSTLLAVVKSDLLRYCRSAVDAVIVGTPISLDKLFKINKPVVRSALSRVIVLSDWLTSVQCSLL